MLSWYQGLSLRWKLRLPLLLLVVLILYMGMHSISTSKLLGGNAKDIAKINLPEIQLLIQADRDLYQALIAERALFQVDADLHRELLVEHADNAKQAQDRVNQSFDLSKTATEAERQEFTRRFNVWKSQAQEILDSVQLNDEASKAAAIQKSYGPLAQSFEHLRAYIDELQEQRLVEVEQFSQEIDENFDSNSTWLLAIVTVAALVSLLAVFFCLSLSPTRCARSATASAILLTVMAT